MEVHDVDWDMSRVSHMRFMQKYVGHPFRKERTIGILKYSYSLLDSDILEFIQQTQAFYAP